MELETKVKERSILFRGDLVRAILEGRKTMTRRPVKPQPHEMWNAASVHPTMPWVWRFHRADDYDFGGYKDCPYGQPGDRLWVRETFTIRDRLRAADHCRDAVDYKAGSAWHELKPDFIKWTPSIHMPRWASRITLEIVSVRVERIQEITAMNALAEGIVSRTRPRFRMDGYGLPHWPEEDCRQSPVDAFERAWNATYPGSWDRNDWVWVIEFKRLEPSSQTGKREG